MRRLGQLAAARGIQPGVAQMLRVGRHLSLVAGRVEHGALGNRPPTILRKLGIRQTWAADGGGEREMIALGGACSEIVGHGPQLAELLLPGLEYEASALDALMDGGASPALVQHTSVAVAPELPPFVESLEAHLPSHRDDWCVSLQVEGASAVAAAVELCLQLQASRGEGARSLVAVAKTSYHGAPTNSLGYPPVEQSAAWEVAMKPWALPYPAPTPFASAEAWAAEFDAFLDEHGPSLGVLVVEPQWGSSCAGAVWPPELLARAVERARAAGALVLADEVMCGLSRHGVRRAGDGRPRAFLSDALGIEVDAVTFGKAVAAGAHPLSGAVLLRGASELAADGRALVQVHTYAGASPRALLTATAVLDALPSLHDDLDRASAALDDGLAAVVDASRGRLLAQGQGLLRGALLDPALPLDAKARAAAVGVLRRRCHAEGVVPYFCTGGFLLTPPYDADVDDVREGCERLRRAVEGWEF